VNGLGLATDTLLNDAVLNGEVIVEAGLGANRLFVENGFVAGWLNGLGLLVETKAFCGVDDGKLGATAGVPEVFGPPASPNIKNDAHVSQEKSTCT
jgi:hypothetical protein